MLRQQLHNLQESHRYTLIRTTYASILKTSLKEQSTFSSQDLLAYLHDSMLV